MAPCEFRPVRRRLLAALVAIGWLMTARAASAWQQYHTSAGKPMRWPAALLQQPLPYGLDDSGLSSDGLAPTAVVQATQLALAQWAALTCQASSAAVEQAGCAAGAAAMRPLGVAFHWLGWQPAQAIGLGCAGSEVPPCTSFGPNGNQVTFVHSAANWPYGKGVIAMTVVSAVKSTGAIGDADVAVNDANYVFCLDSCAPGQVHYGAMILHEAGHFLGMDHSAVATAVMHAVPPLEISQMGTLQPDDRAGACAAYPADATPVTCVAEAPAAAAPADAGCRAAPVAVALPWAALLSIGWWLVRPRVHGAQSPPG